ncbi:hypothetical protein [Nocardia sp. NPDC024068]|uniref:hypothetical protein n=1 Tax=Nocardia sp. NPDC024068 TaxID=3157197 RepID=UPI0033C4F53C
MGGSGVHLCGSVPLPDAAGVFIQVATRLGVHITRIPDGETGDRGTGVPWQLTRLRAHPDLVVVPPPGPEYGPGERVRPAPGIDPAAIDFGPLGYAESALRSWQVFERVRADGAIRPGIRFQVSLPTPVAVTGALCAGPQAALEQRWEAGILDELARICAAVPHQDLAIQWDAAAEFALLEGASPSWFGDDRPAIFAGVVERLVRLGEAVPEGVQTGYHLCYGDFGHPRATEPADTSKLVAVASGIVHRLTRPLDWIHLPVPEDRADEEYYGPLAALALAPETDLYLGLVHAADGFDGARRRIKAAQAFAPRFGIATECGMGRRPADQVPALLDLHACLANSLD